MILTRLNLPNVLVRELIDYPSPLTLSYFWSFGSLAGIFLGIQLLTGIFLAMHYTPHVTLAFSSVEHIMRDVEYGWLLRYIHSNGASFFFFVVYMHMARGLFFCSYLPPKQHLWSSGIAIYGLMMATAFLGYVLPWGQMSFWAATVITNIITALPFGDGGESFAIWLWGGFSVDNPTLNRFYSLHYLLPFVISALAIIHIFLLHEDGSTDPTFRTKEVDVISFYPYFVVKDLVGLFIIFFFFGLFVFFSPNFLGHPDNYVEANALVTPKHIVPEWYFLPFYGLLRAIPNKYLGIAFMFGSLLILLKLPTIGFEGKKNYYNSSGFWTYNMLIWYRFVTIIFFVNFIMLGWLGSQPVEPIFVLYGLTCTGVYFFYFIIIWWLYKKDKQCWTKNNSNWLFVNNKRK